MKKIQKLLLIPILSFPIITLASCSSINSFNQSENTNNSSSEEVSSNLTDDQIVYIGKENVDIFVSKFSNLISNNGVLDLSIFKNLETIKSNAFMGKNIKSIIFNNKITRIEKNAFKGMNSLKELIIPESITFIGENAFDNAFANDDNIIVSFKQNSKIKGIGNNAFANNEKIKISVTHDTIKNLLISANFKQDKIINDESNLGGYFSGLNIDKYLTIISTLDINKNTILSSLTNEKLNEKLNQNFPNKNYKLSISNNSSEYQGVLNLSLSINGNSSENITISRFNSLKDENYIISKMNINSDKWFNDLKKETDVNNWNKEQWIPYLSNLELFSNNKEYDLLKIGNNVTYTFEYNSDKKTVFILLSTNYKKFDGTNWINESSNLSNKRIGILNNTGFKIEFPNKNNLYDFIKNVLEINDANKDSYISQKYSSYYLHSLNHLKQNTLLNNIIKIPDKYLDYIKEILSINGNDMLSIEFNNVFPNDIDGILKFNYDFKKSGNIDETLFMGSYEIAGFKKINKNNINISTSILKDSSLFKTNLRQINNSLSKAQLKAMTENQVIELNNFGFGITNNTINLLTDNSDEDFSSKKSKFDQQMKNYSILINGVNLDSDRINLNTNYLNTNYINDEEGYIIKYLSISANKNLKATIKKSHLWTYSFPITISLGISNSDNFFSSSTFDMEIEANCSMTILSRDIDSLKK